MAIFTLTDITFGGDQRTGSSGPLIGSPYESNTYRFPSDLGNYGRGHYIVIHINVQEETSFPYTEAQGDSPTIISNRKNFGTPSSGQNFTSGVEGLKKLDAKVLNGTFSSALTNASNLINDITGGMSGEAGEYISNKLKNYGRIEGARTIKRTTDTIALYMPDTVNFVTNQHFDSLSTTGTPAAALAAGASAAQATDVEGFARNMAPFVANYLMDNAALGNFGKQMFAATYGMVQNPMLDVIYSSPEFRSFNFEFMFYPKSEKEAETIYRIINRLQFHQAPEIKKEYNGYFLVPPSEFDIKFYYNGAENPNIQPMSTAVLESINIDYAPNGYTTYEVPGQTKPTIGGTGSPVAIRMNLQFKEVEILTKDNFSNSGGVSQNAIDAVVNNVIQNGWKGLVK